VVGGRARLEGTVAPGIRGASLSRLQKLRGSEHFPVVQRVPELLMSELLARHPQAAAFPRPQAVPAQLQLYPQAPYQAAVHQYAEDRQVCYGRSPGGAQREGYPINWNR